MATRKLTEAEKAFQATDEAMDGVVLALRKLRQRMFAAYVRQQPANEVQLKGLRELASKVTGVALLLEDPTAEEAKAYANAEEACVAMLDDSDDMELTYAVGEAFDTSPEDEDAEPAPDEQLDKMMRASDYASYLARGCPLNKYGDPQPLR